jgi:hypothetical protein
MLLSATYTGNRLRKFYQQSLLDKETVLDEEDTMLNLIGAIVIEQDDSINNSNISTRLHV